MLLLNYIVRWVAAGNKLTEIILRKRRGFSARFFFFLRDLQTCAAPNFNLIYTQVFFLKTDTLHLGFTNQYFKAEVPSIIA